MNKQEILQTIENLGFSGIADALRDDDQLRYEDLQYFIMDVDKAKRENTEEEFPEHEYQHMLNLLELYFNAFLLEGKQLQLLKQTIRKIILEEDINDNNDPSWPLEKYPFPFEQKDTFKKDYPEADQEKDTEAEYTLRHFLDQHFNHNLPLPDEQLKLILGMIDKKQYPDIFKLYTSSKAYRGMVIPKTVFKQKFGDFPEKPKWYKAPLDWLSGIAKKELDKEQTYTPSTRSRDDEYISQAANPDLHIDSDASSWSKSFGAAKAFAKKKAGVSDIPLEDLVGVILIADASKSKFIDMEPIYKYFTFASHYAWEEEVISVGNVTYDSIAWRYGKL